MPSRRDPARPPQVSEKQSLQETVRRLMREALKYENLRRSILSAVSDDHVGAAGASVLNVSQNPGAFSPP